MSRLHTRAKLAGKVLQYVPFLRLAALNGSIVRGEETAKSDIDILIIAKAGRLYTCRAFATLLIHLTGWRRHGKKAAGRICLNCYLADNSLNIFPEYKKSISKVVRAYKYMIPLVDDEVSQKFFAKNRWFSKYKVVGQSHSKLLKETPLRNYPYVPKRPFERILSGKLGDWVERKMMRFQVQKINSKKKQNDELFVSEKAIKLHPNKH